MAFYYLLDYETLFTDVKKLNAGIAAVVIGTPALSGTI